MKSADHIDSLAFLDRLFMDSGLFDEQSTVFYHQFRQQPLLTKDLDFLSNIDYINLLKEALIANISPRKDASLLKSFQMKKLNQAVGNSSQDLRLCSSFFRSAFPSLHRHIVRMLQTNSSNIHLRDEQKNWQQDRILALVFFDANQSLGLNFSQKIRTSFNKMLHHEWKRLRYATASSQYLVNEVFTLLKLFNINLDDKSQTKLHDLINEEKKLYWWQKRSKNRYKLFLELITPNGLFNLTQGWIYFVAKTQITHIEKNHPQLHYYSNAHDHFILLKNIFYTSMVLLGAFFLGFLLQQALSVFIINMAPLFSISIMMGVVMYSVFGKKPDQSDLALSDSPSNKYFFRYSQMISFFDQEKKDKECLSSILVDGSFSQSEELKLQYPTTQHTISPQKVETSLIYYKMLSFIERNKKYEAASPSDRDVRASC